MINLFRNNLFFTSLLLLPYALLLRSQELIYGNLQVYTDGGILFNTVNSWFPNDLSKSIFSAILIFLQAWVISYFVNRNKLANDANLIAGVFYIILISLLPEYNGLTPVILANTFLILAYGSLSDIYRKPRSEISLFNAGVFIGMASLFYLPYVVFVIVGFLGIYILNSLKIVNVLQFISGFVIPFFLCVTYVIYYESTHLIESYIAEFGIRLDWISDGRYGSYVLAIFGLLIMIVVFSYNGFMIKKSIQVQKKVDMIFWILFIGLVSTVVTTKLDYPHIQIIVFPLAVLLSLGFMRIKNVALSELLHLVLLAMLFTLHFSLHLLLVKG